MPSVDTPTATPTASKIPIADSNGKLNSWVDAFQFAMTAGEAINSTSTPIALYQKKVMERFISSTLLRQMKRHIILLVLQCTAKMFRLITQLTFKLMVSFLILQVLPLVLITSQPILLGLYQPLRVVKC